MLLKQQQQKSATKTKSTILYLESCFSVTLRDQMYREEESNVHTYVASKGHFVYYKLERYLHVVQTVSNQNNKNNNNNYIIVYRIML